jgi:hypothetical protein
VNQDEELREILEGDDQAIAENDVISAARSCSAIFVIFAIVGTILCVMAGIAYVF